MSRVGISSIGVYIPRFRLDRALIGKAWGKKMPAGEKAIANYDEDALTMAVAAAHLCLADVDASRFDAAYFASTSSPYREKQVASVVATACDLPREIQTADFTGSVRSGLAALLAAIRLVQSGGAKRVLVTIADCRPVEPESELEAAFGDGAVALVVDGEAKLAEFVASASVAEELTFQWRRDVGTCVQVQDQRFALTHGFLRDLGEVVGRVLNENGLGTEDLAALAVGSPDARAAQDLAKRVGIDAKTQLVPSLSAQIGVLGSPDPIVLLASALERAKPGDAIVTCGFGEGADALLFRAAAKAGVGGAPSLAASIERKLSLPTYEKYLKFRRWIGQDDSPIELISNVLEARELRQDVRLYGSKCRACGMVQYPMARVCLDCKKREDLESAKIQKTGEIFTFTVDHLAANLDHPLGMVVCDMDGGGRLYLQMTDCTADDVKIGNRIELTYRRLHQGGENYNYYWKARPQ